MKDPIQLVECPRDAMQGWPEFIPTEQKIAYLNELLSVGFHTLDFGSFVSPKAIPQMADTRTVLDALSWAKSNTSLLAIVANVRGAEQAAELAGIRFLGFPFSVSETFQRRNTNSSIADSLERVKDIQAICRQNGKKLVVYLSMAFGNPYGDVYTNEDVLRQAERCLLLGVDIISLADTVGLATPRQVLELTALLTERIPQATIGLHLHAGRSGREQKLQAALDAGCRRFDGALKGIGGCPMSGDDLVGNLDTAWMIGFLKEKGFPVNINEEAFRKSLALADQVFGK